MPLPDNSDSVTSFQSTELLRIRLLYQQVNPRWNNPSNYQKLVKLGEYQKICQGQFYGGVLGEEGKTGQALNGNSNNLSYDNPSTFSPLGVSQITS